MSEAIKGFKLEPYKFLSNFARCWVDLDEWSYYSVEHAYQAAKTLDKKQRRLIMNTLKPGEAKRLGKTVTMRPDWEDIKLQVMEDLLRQKFNQQPFRKLLLATGDAYIEETNNWGDIYWGRCNGYGHNHLGDLIMKIRKELQDDQA